MQNEINTILNFTDDNKCIIILNNKFECTFRKLYNDSKNSDPVFSEKIKDINCPVFYQYANVNVKDIISNINYVGRIFIDKHLDNNSESMSLVIKEHKNIEVWEKLYNIINIEIKEKDRLI